MNILKRMKLLTSPIILGLILLLTSAQAGDPALDANVVTDAGNIWTAVSNFGRWGDPDATLPSWEWPGGQSSDYLWEGRFWVGAKVSGIPHVTHADYGDYEWHAALDDPLSVAPGISDQDVIVYFDDELASATHFPLDLRVEERHLSWSSVEYHNLFGLELLIINTGGYTLEEMYFGFCFDHDVTQLDPTEPHIDDWVDYDGEDGADSDSDRRDWVDPMDLDGDGLTGYDAYGWPWIDPVNPQYDPDLAEPDGIYDEYRFWEDSNGPDVIGQAGTVFEGQVLTNSFGIPLQGYLLPRGLSYMYDGDNPNDPWEDTGERYLTPPATGFCGTCLLYCPTDTTANPWSHQWWNWNNDPGNDEEKYSFMEGTHFSAGGRRFLPRPNELGEPVWDYRYLLSCGPYTMSPDDTMQVAMAFTIGEGLQGVREWSDRAMDLYYDGSAWSSPLTPSSPDEDIHWGGGDILAVKHPTSQIVSEMTLRQPVPNPFNSSVSISFSLPSQTKVDLGVYNVQGRKIADLIQETKPAGLHVVNWKPDNASSGLLFFRLTTDEKTQTVKGIFLK
ncbi:hypothetical protein CEE37_05250 [candidate division LCP-89 bacterium B3_LCP]|uniref:Secretion system C-terminal sorting domain-containing protein n=1 Tax=candidate division LCP-89 bacterium B3_LCP TaxID=2012998 RepID=A0A532V1I4_UNCL8|nr:MAG: hypothetical protein CEE37_05250 [candidate division LCP-89 bacterium B3_LCP]